MFETGKLSVWRGTPHSENLCEAEVVNGVLTVKDNIKRIP